MFLQKTFFSRNTVTVAKELLGKVLVVNSNGKINKGRISEVEAYGGFEDDACHGFKGKTERNSILFKSAGYIYVYFTYGMHYLLNIITEQNNYPSGILIRGVIPISDLNTISLNRFNKKYSNLTQTQIKNLTNGPSKVCKAFGIDKRFNNTKLITNKPITNIQNWIAVEKGTGIKNKKFLKSKRVGVEYAEKAKEWDWNFKLID